MKCVVDANVFVAALRASETEHVACRSFLQRCLQSTVTVICPAIILAEIAGCIARAMQSRSEAELALLKFQKHPGLRLLPVTEALAESAARLAARHFLKGADALYLATAKNAGTLLVTLDGEILSRGGSIVAVQTPAGWLADHPT